MPEPPSQVLGQFLGIVAYANQIECLANALVTALMLTDAQVMAEELRQVCKSNLGNAME